MVLPVPGMTLTSKKVFFAEEEPAAEPDEDSEEAFEADPEEESEAEPEEESDEEPEEELEELEGEADEEPDETLDEERDEEGRTSLVGTLDVKGALALARHSRAVALASYAETQRGRPPHRMALTLDGFVVGAMELTSALRGSRFRVAGAPSRDEAAALRDALRVDRRCFPGR